MSTTITDEQAALLATHAIVVQGGFSTPEVERERAEKDLARGATFNDAFWEKIKTEVLEHSKQLPTPEPAVAGPIDRIKRYKDLRDQQKVHEAEVDGIKAEADLLEKELIDYFLEADLQNLKVDGRTVYLHPQTYAARKEGVTAEDVKAALIASDLAHLVTETVNSNTLSAYVRQQDAADVPLPAPLAAVVELGSTLRLKVRK